MRLTKKSGYHYYAYGIKEKENKNGSKRQYGSAITKLGQLEDIEEELGIDLVILFKAYTNGFYVKGEKHKQYIDFKNPLNSVAFRNKEIFYGHKYCYQYVKTTDYPKSWALTKEELL